MAARAVGSVKMQRNSEYGTFVSKPKGTANMVRLRDIDLNPNNDLKVRVGFLLDFNPSVRLICS